MSSSRRCWLVAGLVLALLCVVTTATAGTAAAASGGPNLTVSVANQSVEDGGRLVVGRTPRIDVAARSATANGSLQTVLVEVDGETAYQATDLDARLDTDRSLPLAAGNNTVRVIVEDGDGAVTAWRFRVYLETVPPSFALGAPVRTDPRHYSFRNVVVEDAAVTLRGRFADRSGVREGSVVFDRPGSGSVSVSSPDPTFRLPVFLRYGANQFTVSTTDGRGNQYFDSFTVRLVDPEPPTLSVDPVPRLVNDSHLVVSGTARDNVWVNNVTVKASYVGRTPYQAQNATYEPVGSRPYSYDRRRLNASFQQRLKLLTGLNYLTVTATDHLGQRTTRDYWVEYAPERQTAPRISIDEDRTRIVDDRTLNLSALVTDADEDLRRVSVLVTTVRNQSVSDVAVLRVKSEESLLVDQSFTVRPGQNRVRLRATDATGNTTELAVLVDTRSTGDDRVAVTTSTPGVPITETGPTTTAAGAGGTPTTEPSAPTRTRTGGGPTATQSSGGGLLPELPLAQVALGVVATLAVAGFVVYRRLTRV